MAIDGLELPDPLTGTVVLGAGAGATVVLVVLGAAVVGGVVDAVVALLGPVPWVPVAPAGALAGAVSAEAGPAASTRKRPARSARDATHLRGLTTSILGSELIGLQRPPRGLVCAGGVDPPQGRGRFNTPSRRSQGTFGPLTWTFTLLERVGRTNGS